MFTSHNSTLQSLSGSPSFRWKHVRWTKHSHSLAVINLCKNGENQQENCLNCICLFRNRKMRRVRARAAFAHNHSVHVLFWWCKIAGSLSNVSFPLCFLLFATIRRWADECGVKTKCENVWFLFLGENNIVHWKYMLLGGISQSAWRERRKKIQKIIADPHKQSHRDYSKSHHMENIHMHRTGEWMWKWCARVCLCLCVTGFIRNPTGNSILCVFIWEYYTCFVSLAMCHSWWSKWSNEKEWAQLCKSSRKKSEGAPKQPKSENCYSTEKC